MEDCVLLSPSILVATNSSFYMSFSYVLKPVKWNIHLLFDFKENTKHFLYEEKMEQLNAGEGLSRNLKQIAFSTKCLFKYVACVLAYMA